MWGRAGLTLSLIVSCGLLVAGCGGGGKEEEETSRVACKGPALAATPHERQASDPEDREGGDHANGSCPAGIVLDLPLSRPQAVAPEIRARVTRALGVEPRAIVRGAAANAAYYAELANAAAVRAATPDLPADFPAPISRKR